MAPVATNVYPAANSYRPIPGPAAYSDALTTNPRGAWLAQTTAGDFRQYVAEETEISKLEGTSWTSLGTGYNCPSGEHWAGTQFGTAFYFNNINDGLLKSDVDGVGTIAAVGGTAPAAKTMDAVEGYLMHGNLSDDPFAVEWSDTEDGDTYGSGNSDIQTFPDLGAVTAIAGNDNLIIQEYGIRQIIFDPSGDIFQFEKIEQGKGSISPYSVVRYGAGIAYLAEDGFWFNGEAIGQHKVNRYFLNTVNADEIFSVLGRAHPTLPIFWWHYRTTGGATYDAHLLYNWQTREWASASFDILFASQSATTATTLEQLSAAYPNLDTLVPYPLDSRVWLGGRPEYSIIDTDKKLAFLDGNSLAATIATSERQLIPDRRARVRGVRPIVDNANATIKIRTRERLGNTGTSTSAISQQTSGICKTNKGARYHRFTVDIPAAETWTHAQGVEIPDDHIAPMGRR